MKSLHTICFLILPGLVSCHEEDKPLSSGKPGIDQVKLTDLNNKPIDMRQYHGKTVFVNFWATWCKPCREEMPSLQRVRQQFRNEDIEFLFASDESKSEIEDFDGITNYGFHFVIAVNMEELNVLSLPATFIFDATGKLAFSEMGAREWDSPESIALLKKITEQ